jgi:hypothetical protein
MRKKALPLLILAMLWLPAFSTLLHFERRPLFQMRGVTAPHPFPDFSFECFRNKEYQRNFESWLNYKLPANVLPAKTFNSIYYRVFKKTYSHANHIIIGKNNFLYEKGYVISYVKNDYPDNAAIDGLAADLLTLQESLGRRGKRFLLVITPSKANMTPRNIPDRYFIFNEKLQERDIYALTVGKFRESGVHAVDCYEALASRAAGEAFFYPGGIHWNDYARKISIDAVLASLGLDARLEEAGRHTPPAANAVDGDLAGLLNLLQPPVDYETLQIRLAKRDKAVSAKVALIGGSFASGIMDYLVEGGIFQALSFYYYFTTAQVYTVEDVQTSGNVKEQERLASEILEHDLVILEVNQEILYSYGAGHARMFIEAMLSKI